MSNEDRYRLALERIVNLEHDEGCTTKCCPLFECGCYEKSPHELAQMALEGIDWTPSARKDRALTEFAIPDDADEHPFWQLRRFRLGILSRLDENAFTGRSLCSRHLDELVVEVATHAELTELRRLADAEEVVS